MIRYALVGIAAFAAALVCRANNVLIQVTADPPANGSSYACDEIIRVAVRLNDETTDVNSLELAQVDLRLTNAILVPDFDPDDTTNPIFGPIVFGGAPPGDGETHGAAADAYPGPLLPGCPQNYLVGSAPSSTGGGTICFWIRTSTSTAHLLNPPRASQPGRLFIQFKIQFHPLCGTTVDALGPALDDGSSSGAFFQQAGTSTMWSNGDADLVNNVVAGILSLQILTPPACLVSANPPLSSPYLAGAQPFRDVLQNSTTALAPQGIGVVGTSPEGPVTYETITVTYCGFGPPSPPPSPAQIGVICTDITGNGQADCPSIVAVIGCPSTPCYHISLSGPPPPRECITFTFGHTPEKLQYQVLPGDTNMDGQVNTQDLLWLVQRVNDGTANLPANRARYNINRSNDATGPVVNTQDVLRLLQLLNGTNATQPFNGATVAPCPP
ncbi:MAG TPA: hypothetical protein VGM03_12235 [Phycisphaerae bacterium]